MEKEWRKGELYTALTGGVESCTFVAFLASVGFTILSSQQLGFPVYVTWQQQVEGLFVPF